MKLGQWDTNTIYNVDALELLKGLPDESVNCIVTSPPYFGLRSYTDADGREIGKEETPEQYVAALVEIFCEARRVLRSDGTFWLNLGDCYAGSGKGAWNRDDVQKSVYVPGVTGSKIKNSTPGIPPKSLLMIPHRVALALQADGWIVRQDNVWQKPNPMPDPVKDRTTRAHEYVFQLAKSPRYYYDSMAVAEPASGVGGGGFSKAYAEAQPQHGAMRLERPKNRTLKQDCVGKRTYTGFNERCANRDTELEVRNKHSVWTINPKPFKGAHFAVIPPALVKICILAGCPEGGVVLDPFMGSGTVARVAHKLGRQYLGCDINPAYVDMARNSLQQMSLYELTEATP